MATCLDCNAHPKKLCPVHARVSNHDTDEDLELDRLREENRKLREALKEALAVMRLSDPRGDRARLIDAPEDAEIYRLCELIGYGAVMDSAARQWRKKDPIGAHTTGACAATVQDGVSLADAALSQTKGGEE